MKDVIEAIQSLNPQLTQFEDSCFSGEYVTEEVTEEYLNALETARGAGRKDAILSAASAFNIISNLGSPKASGDVGSSMCVMANNAVAGNTMSSSDMSSQILQVQPTTL